MSKSAQHELVQMDGGTAQHVDKLINEQVGCSENLHVPFSNNGIEAYVFSGMLQQYSVICRELARISISDEPKDLQCVVLSGDPMRCPIYGKTATGESNGEHERIARIVELQEFIDQHLTQHDTLNFKVFKK